MKTPSRVYSSYIEVCASPPIILVFHYFDSCCYYYSYYHILPSNPCTSSVCCKLHKKSHKCEILQITINLTVKILSLDNRRANLTLMPTTSRAYWNSSQFSSRLLFTEFKIARLPYWSYSIKIRTKRFDEKSIFHSIDFYTAVGLRNQSNWRQFFFGDISFFWKGLEGEWETGWEVCAFGLDAPRLLWPHACGILGR